MLTLPSGAPTMLDNNKEGNIACDFGTHILDLKDVLPVA